MDYQVKVITVPRDVQPKKVKELNWGGDVLIIKMTKPANYSAYLLNSFNPI